ncbi:MAG: Tol-Pal system beta propeller repeat protein TolB [Candidatus Hydrogenedentes bacterium]|nr:Tol-Pal system beta propeller repeat protein TolB [Candidatus Hydrogenedentota bacterium]
MITMKRIALFWIVILLTGFQVRGQDQGEKAVRITTEASADRRICVAVPPFAVADPQFQTVAAEMAQVVADDLEFSGLFVVLPPAQYPAGFTGLDSNVGNVNLPMWRAARAENLVYGYVYQEGTSLVGQFRLFDLYANTQLYGQEVRVEKDHFRLASHRFSEEAIRVVDGIPGIGTTEIFFAGTMGPGVKEIYAADYDGANVRRLTNHQSLSIMPELSPNGADIAYLSYKDRYCFLYVFNRASGTSQALSKEVGLNSAAMWAPDGQRLAMTLSKDGNAEIYLRDKNGSNSVRITNNKDGDTSPTFSPDGGRIAFVSDRAGRPQVYVMNADGSGQNRLSFHGGAAYDPVWSPDGKMIAFVSSSSGEGLEIYMMGADGSNPTRLTNSNGINEAPCWSPDSRHIAFTSNRRGRPELWAITLSTMTERPISRIEMAAEGPTWGPRRK